MLFPELLLVRVMRFFEDLKVVVLRFDQLAIFYLKQAQSEPFVHSIGSYRNPVPCQGVHQTRGT